MTRAPEQIDTERLLLLRPRASDADAIFSRYASDEDVTRYLSWPRHQSVQNTGVFIAYSDAEWERWGCGPYMIIDRAQCRRPKAEAVEQLKAKTVDMQKAEGATAVPRAALLGSTGLSFETPTRAMTGYVLAKNAWGRGYATEALKAMIDLARALGVSYLYALCNADHRPSWHILEKCGMTREPDVGQFEFPNLGPGRFDTFRYSIHL